MIEILALAILTVAVISSWNNGYHKGISVQISEKETEKIKQLVYREIYDKGVMEGANVCLELLKSSREISDDYIIRYEENRIVLYKYENSQ